MADKYSVESGNPPSNLGMHQWLSLPSGAVYTHIDSLRYRINEGEEVYGGKENFIRIFKEAGSDNVTATLFLPKIESSKTTKNITRVQNGLLERLGIIEANDAQRFNPEQGFNCVAANYNCVSYMDEIVRVAASHTAPSERHALDDFIKYYAETLQPRYGNEGERNGRIKGGIAGFVGGMASVLLSVVAFEPSVDRILFAGLLTGAATVFSAHFGKQEGCEMAENNDVETLRTRLLKGQ